jgi:uncharacterized protein (TIGR03437 family)
MDLQPHLGLSRRHVLAQLFGAGLFTRSRGFSGVPAFPSLKKRRFSVPLVDGGGYVVARYDASALYFVEDLGAGVTLEMALIPGGTFLMGSPSNSPGRLYPMLEQPVHEVTLRPYAIGVFAVTVGQWRQVSTFPQISRRLHGVPPVDELPVDVVFFYEADEFCQRLRAYTGRPYRLPSESEWEYACRAGTTTKYHFGDGISQLVANYNDGLTRPLALSPVGSKQAPNRFGLHDMHGNVLEWCQDWVHQTYDGAPSDGTAWAQGGDSYSRVARGGSYLFNGDSARSGARYPEDIREAFGGGGFRLALDVPSELFDSGIQGGVIVNAASVSGGSVAPGTIITMHGLHLGPNVPATLILDDLGLVATELSETRVLFDGVPAPLLYASAVQVNAVVPYKVAGQTSTQMTIEVQGQISAPVSVPVAESSPALFTTDSSGQGQGAIVNQDGSLNAIGNPACRGSVVSVFATGEGQTNPPGVDGRIAGLTPPAPVLPLQLFVGGEAAELLYVGGAPEEVAGVLQINARVPDGIADGQQAIVLRVGLASSQAGVFITIG